MKQFFSWMLPFCCLFALALTTFAFDDLSGDQATTSPAEPSQLEFNSEEKQILADLEFLASDDLEGRDTGTAGILEAAAYIQEAFKEAGLTTPENLPEGLQSFSIPGVPEIGEHNQLLVKGKEEEKPWKVREDFVPCSFGSPGEFAGQVVFCGYGIADSEHQFDEYAGIDLKGKVALILRRVPGQSRPGTTYVSENGIIDAQSGSLRSKLNNARERGAIAVLFVNDPITVSKQGKDELLTIGSGGTASGPLIPAMHITNNKANELIKQGLGISLADWSQKMEESLSPASASLNEVSIQGRADLKFDQLTAFNVVGVLEPADPKTAETIVIGAHYDHVGWGSYGSLSTGPRAIHNGADDNASGTAALLNLARKLSGLTGKLSKRVVLIAFSAEERGLLGAKHYVSAPLYPLESTYAMLNLDMVGRMSDEKLTVFGVGSSPVWNGWLDPIEEQTGLKFFREQKALGPSDHAPFYQKQVPVLHLFTGLHEDYHRPTDDIDEINLQGIRLTTEVLEQLILKLNDAQERPDYVENKNWIRVGNHAGGRPHVGLSPDLSQTGKGYPVGQIFKKSPAQKAGIKTGDFITHANGQEISSRQDFWKQIDSLGPKETIKLTIQRGNEQIETELTLAFPR